MLSVILPAYNEKDMIPVAAETLAGILDKEGIAFELLFGCDLPGTGKGPAGLRHLFQPEFRQGSGDVCRA